VRGFITDPAAPGGLRLADDLPEPEPAADELLLDVRAFAINRGETFLLQQRPDGWRPGQDVAGVVARAAADGSGPREGARVVGIVEWEGWAERVSVPVIHAAELPDDVGFEEAAALPIAGLTALRALRVKGPLLGRGVLVTGATGGVGQFAVQLAVASGAVVTAHVSGPEREQEARELGAHEVVWELGESSGPFDLVCDALGGAVMRDAIHRLARDGVVVSYGALGGKAELDFTDFMASRTGSLRGLLHSDPQETKGADLATLVQLVADGRLRPLVGLTRDWEQTNDVIAALRNREVRGKAVLTRS
jgi:NADPH:quinone reductase